MAHCFEYKLRYVLINTRMSNLRELISSCSGRSSCVCRPMCLKCSRDHFHPGGGWRSSSRDTLPPKWCKGFAGTPAVPDVSWLSYFRRTNRTQVEVKKQRFASTDGGKELPAGRNPSRGVFVQFPLTLLYVCVHCSLRDKQKFPSIRFIL